MDDVAREARVSRATVYRYFPGGKDQLVRDVVAWESGRFFANLAAAVAGAPDFASLVEEALLFAHRAVEGHAVLQRILSTEPELLLPQLTGQSDRLLALIEGFLLPSLRSTPRRDGVTAEQAANFIARMLLSFIGSQGGWDLTDRHEVKALAAQLTSGVMASGD